MKTQNESISMIQKWISMTFLNKIGALSSSLLNEWHKLHGKWRAMAMNMVVQRLGAQKNDLTRQHKKKHKAKE